MPKLPVDNGLINLNFFRKKAKKLLQQMKAGQASKQRLLFEQVNPHADLTLASAQWLVANELGFSSWPKLKAHVDTVSFAANNPNFIADNENQTVHWRCGHDIEHKLRVAGFTGTFVPFTDPFCLGPVPSLPFEQYRSLRTHTLSQYFSIPLKDIYQQFDQEYHALSQLAESEKVVFWCEADPYDQLFLIRVLASLNSNHPPLELIDIASIPGVKRFVGFGQLSPDILPWLWAQRRTIGQTEIEIAKQLWAAFTNENPTDFAKLARQRYATLPLLGPALFRMLQEYPNNQTGLSLTESLTLHYLRDNPGATLEDTFKALVDHLEPLPFLGDLMFYCLLKPCLIGASPLLTSNNQQLSFEKQPLSLSKIGENVLNGSAYALDYIEVTRWVGGVSFSGKKSHWTIDNEQELVWRLV
ncbi:DUF1835 domain-containing protein [Providencia sp.]|uniref:DUF1835 domain-containing protein n=1 Tax=Providencia sp. TaxID=589 RepID=UPI00333F8652